MTNSRQRIRKAESGGTANAATEADIDALYGLEPVLDVADGPATGELEQALDVDCPYCAESIAVRVDLSAGDQNYVEDCQVCCQPMQMIVSLDQNGDLESLRAERMDR